VIEKVITIAICDDDKLTANYMEEYILSLPIKDIFYDIFMTGHDLMNYLENNNVRYNIYILDIEMPGINGIETASHIRRKDKNALIIFSTDHKEYVYQVFEVLPFRFIIKPLTKERLTTVLYEAFEHIQTMGQLFFFKKERNNFQIPFRDILYFEGNGRKVRLNTVTGEHEFYSRLRDITGKVDANLFLQIHISYLVNMEHIHSISESEVLLDNHIRLPISKKFRQDAKMQHLKYMEWRCGH